MQSFYDVCNISCYLLLIKLRSPLPAEPDVKIFISVSHFFKHFLNLIARALSVEL